MKRFILILIHSFFILFFISSLSAQSNNKSTKNQIRNIEQKMAALPHHEKKLNSLLLDIVNKISIDNAKENMSGEKISKTYSSSLSIVDNEARIYVKITLHDTTSTENIDKLVFDLENQEVVIENIYVPEINIKSRPIIFARIKYSLIKEIAKDNRIVNIANVIKPYYNIGSVTTEGDSLLNAKLARLQHGVDGGTLNSVKIGVISNGIQDYQASIDSGDVNNISWISGHEQAPGNEGLAMIEIIQDLAPGSMPMFGSAEINPGHENLISVINELYTWGCDIIVDDVGYFNEPMFQDSDLAAAIASKISSQGLTYISSAGNNGTGMWTGEMNTDPDSMHIWSEDGQNNYDIRNYIAGDTISIFMQWDDNWQDAENNYDLYLFNSSGTSVGSGGKTVQGSGLNQEPYENLYYAVPNTGDYYIQVRGVSGDFTRDKKVVVKRFDLEYTYSNIYATSPGEQIYGHAAAVDVISVAAFPADDPSILEDYSSRGPTILSPYTSPETRNTPVITATDGVATGVPGFEAFYGTSASAPHIAGIAALYFDKYGSSKSNQDFLDDLKDAGQGIAGGTNGQWNKNSGYGKADAYLTLGDIPSSVTFYQYDSSGSYVDSVSHWIGYWKKDRAPHTYEWGLYSNHVVEATDKIINNEKYHHWNVDEYLNHKNVYVSAGLPNQEAYLQPVVDLVTIKTELTAGGSGGNIDFKDPWYEDFNEPPYGYRNRGTAAIFQPHSSPLNLTLSPPYKGVFLNQDPQVTPTYYSVRATHQETFQAHREDFSGYFLNWEATGAEFQSPNGLTTPVIFRQENTIVKALYKGNMVSENSIATGYNNARRMVRDGSGTYHMVYEDNNEIWYTYSSDGISWTGELRISSKSNEDEGYHNPAIALDGSPSGPMVHVAWECINESGFSGVEHYVCYRYKDYEGWSSIEYLPPDPMFQFYYLSSESIKPAIYAESDGYVITAWKIKCEDDEQERVFICLRTQGEWTEIEEVPEADGHPAITRKIAGGSQTKLVWSDGSNIRLISGDHNGEEWEWDEVEYVSESSPAYYVNDQPSIVVDENNYLHITWQKRELTGPQRKFIVHKDDEYNYQTEFLKTGYTMYSPSVTANTSNGNIRLAYHVTTSYGLSSVRTVESPHTKYFWSPEELISYDSRYPSFVSRSPISFLTYTKYNGAPYFLKTIQPYSQKSNTSNITEYSRRKEINFDNIQLTRDKVISGKINLEVEFDDFYSGFISQPSTSDNFLQTPVFIPASDSLKIAYKISLYDLAVKKNSGIISSSYPDIEINLIDNKSQTIISKRQHLFSDLVKSLSDTTYEFNFQLNTRAFITKEIYLNFDFITSNKNDVILSQIYTFDYDSSGKLNSEYFAKDVIIPIPEKFTLHPAYPNPFNPATKIAFDIPEQSDVSLKVFDIQGKVVSELFKGNKESGRYTFQFYGSNLSSGIYFYEMVAKNHSTGKNFREVKKMLLVK